MLVVLDIVWYENQGWHGALQPKLPIVFYRTSTGAEIVLHWLRELEIDRRRAIGRDLMRLQYRWPVGMPLCRSMGGGLWELRSDLPGNSISRLLFCFCKGHLVVLHGFIKKTSKTPRIDLELARARCAEYTRNLS